MLLAEFFDLIIRKEMHIGKDYSMAVEAYLHPPRTAVVETLRVLETNGSKRPFPVYT